MIKFGKVQMPLSSSHLNHLLYPDPSTKAVMHIEETSSEHSGLSGGEET